MSFKNRCLDNVLVKRCFSNHKNIETVYEVLKKFFRFLVRIKFKKQFIFCFIAIYKYSNQNKWLDNMWVNKCYSRAKNIEIAHDWSFNEIFQVFGRNEN